MKVLHTKKAVYSSHDPERLGDRMAPNIIWLSRSHSIQTLGCYIYSGVVWREDRPASMPCNSQISLRDKVGITMTIWYMRAVTQCMHAGDHQGFSWFCWIGCSFDLCSWTCVLYITEVGSFLRVNMLTRAVLFLNTYASDILYIIFIHFIVYIISSQSFYTNSS